MSLVLKEKKSFVCRNKILGFAGEFGPVADVQVHVPDVPGIPSVPEAGLNTSKWAKSEPQCQKIQKKTQP